MILFFRSTLQVVCLSFILISESSFAQFGGLLNNLKIPESITNKANEIMNPNTTQPQVKANEPQKCNVSAGYMGVTTFLDDQLKKTGTGPIRDFETTEFWVEKTIIVGKEKVLVGKLYEPALSKVIEPKSFALADEWTCK
jgi:hypothetical protein